MIIALLIKVCNLRFITEALSKESISGSYDYLPACLEAFNGPLYDRLSLSGLAFWLPHVQSLLVILLLNQITFESKR